VGWSPLNTKRLWSPRKVRRYIDSIYGNISDRIKRQRENNPMFLDADLEILKAVTCVLWPLASPIIPELKTVADVIEFHANRKQLIYTGLEEEEPPEDEEVEEEPEEDVREQLSQIMQRLDRLERRLDGYDVD